MKFYEFKNIIETICPNSLAESWDNCGIQLKCENEKVDKALVALEITEAVIDEAIENDVDVILTHHPLIFGGITSVDYNTVTGKYILRLAEADISVYSLHTSFDKMYGGNNDYLGSILELKNVRCFNNDNQFCKMGETPFEITFGEFIHQVSGILEIDEKYFKAVGDLRKNIEKVGWCTGAGAEFIDDAIVENCDLYITGDVKYHDAMKASEAGICILDAGHYGTEKIFIENMANLLRNKMDIDIIESKIDINPFI